MMRDWNTYLGARIDRGSDSKAARSIKEHTIEQVTLSSSVHTCNWNDTDGRVELLQEVQALLIDLKH